MLCDFVFLSKSSSHDIVMMTRKAVSSLIQSIPTDVDCNIIMVESDKQYSRYYENDIGIDQVILYDQPIFNYNHALNQALPYCNGEWVCFCNNDLVFDKNWLCEIFKVSKHHTDILSFSPKFSDKQCDVDLGYTCPGHVLGYCFMCHKTVIEQLGKFDETFDFYFQDNDYAMWLKHHNIKHASVKSSIVTHLGQKTTGKEKMCKLYQDRDKFIVKWGYQTYIENRKERLNYVS